MNSWVNFETTDLPIDNPGVEAARNIDNIQLFFTEKLAYCVFPLILIFQTYRIYLLA